MTLYIDGQYIKMLPSALEAFTPGLFKAKGVFETMLAIGNQVFDVTAHLNRLQMGLKQMRITSNLTVQLPKVIKRVVEAGGFNYARVRVLVWKEAAHVHVAVMALPYKLPTDKPFRVCVIKTNRLASSAGANLKSLDYLLFASAYAQAKSKGFDEALLLNRKGYIFEASRANIFWVQNGVLYTPPLSSGCLNGITRQTVISQAKRLNIIFKEKNLTVAQLINAQGCFLVNSLIGIKQILATEPLPMLK